MSFDAIRWALDQKLKPSPRLLLIELANAVNAESGEASCYPSQAFLKSRTGLGLRTIGECLKVLEELGLITRERRGSSSDLIVLQIGARPAKSADKQNLRDAKSAERDAQNPPKRSAKSAPKPVINQEGNQIPPKGPPIDDAGDDFFLPAEVAPPRNESQAKLLALVVDNGDARRAPIPQSSGRKDGANRAALSDQFREPGFEDWWKIYPHKVGKGDAEKAYLKALKVLAKSGEPAPARKLQAVMAEYAAGCANVPRDRRRFIPHGSTWLNGKRWNDDLQQALETIYGPGTPIDRRGEQADARFDADLAAALGRGQEVR